jgi:hypothetical protein
MVDDQAIGESASSSFAEQNRREINPTDMERLSDGMSNLKRNTKNAVNNALNTNHNETYAAWRARQEAKIANPKTNPIKLRKYQFLIETTRPW